MKQDKYLIGEFSDISGISKRMLRHYDKIKLFSPIEINEENGYRSYSEAQLDELDKIQFLRKLGFSLSSISDLLSKPVGLDDFLEILKDKEVELTQTSDEIKSNLLMAKRMINLLEKESSKTFPSIYKLLDWERSMTMTSNKEALIDLKTLMNRDLFMERVEEIIEGDNNDHYHFITFDIDYFMHVNDIDGYAVGDRVIQSIISIVHNSMSELINTSPYSNVFSRLGGDECSLFLKNCDNEKVIKSIEVAFDKVHNFDFESIGCSRKVTISVGLASGLKPVHYAKLQDQSSRALIEAKRNGRDQYKVVKY